MDYKSLRNPLPQSEIARRSGLSIQVVMKTEQYLYNNPPAPVAEVLAQHQFMTAEAVCEIYAASRQRQRYQNRGKISRVAMMGDLPAMVELAGSRQAFCRLLCIHPSQLNRLLNRDGSSAFLRDAFSDVGIDWVG